MTQSGRLFRNLEVMERYDLCVNLLLLGKLKKLVKVSKVIFIMKYCMNIMNYEHLLNINRSHIIHGFVKMGESMRISKML